MKLFHILAGALVLAGLVHAQGATATATATVEVKQADRPFVQKALYPMTTCVVSGEELEGDSVKTFEVDGRTYKTCCGKCQKKVEADPTAFAAKLDAALVAQQIAAYPLETCPISNKKLGSMGDPVQLVLDDTLVQLCCKGCTKKATATAAAMAEKVRDAAYAQQRASYPLPTCVVTGEKLGDDAVDMMYGTTLVRFCCAGCADDFEQDSATFLGKISAARHASPQAKPADHKGHDAGHGGGAPTAMAAECGIECVQGLTGGCCMEQAAAKTAAPKKAGCCMEQPAAKTVAPTKAGCCGEAGAPAKKAEPAKKIN